MDKNQMKNIVVLKNLPSNLVEEAILILKSNKKARTYKYIDKKENVNQSNSKNQKDYVIREAESVITNYINKIEKKSEKKTTITNKKYKMMRMYSIVITIILFIRIFF